MAEIILLFLQVPGTGTPETKYSVNVLSIYYFYISFSVCKVRQRLQTLLPRTGSESALGPHLMASWIRIRIQEALKELNE
jgi:hypothetical protein